MANNSMFDFCKGRLPLEQSGGFSLISNVCGSKAIFNWQIKLDIIEQTPKESLRQKLKMSDRCGLVMICIYNETPLIHVTILILKYKPVIGYNSTNYIFVYVKSAIKFNFSELKQVL